MRFLQPCRPAVRLGASRIVVGAVVLVALALIGCDDSQSPADLEAPVAPMAPELGVEAVNPNALFYPLEIDNRWHFDRRLVFEFFPAGSTVPTGSEEFCFEEERVLDQTEELFGRTYVVESRTSVQVFPDSGVVHEWVRYRQDRSGLYEADVSINDPPGVESKATQLAVGRQEQAFWTEADVSAFGPVGVAHAASFRNALRELERRRASLRGTFVGERVLAPRGGALPGEFTRLRYPLHVGARFAIREGELAARVEAHEQLVTPAGTFPAWRIRLVWCSPGFDDTILMWFGRCGSLKAYFQGDLAVVAPDGTVLGTMRARDVEVVDEVEVQGRPCGRRPHRPVLDD